MFLPFFAQNLVKKCKKHRVFSLFLQACFAKIAKNIEFLAFWKDACPKCAKTHVFLQFLQIHLVEKRWKHDVFHLFSWKSGQKLEKTSCFQRLFARVIFKNRKKHWVFTLFCKDACPKCGKTRVFLEFLQISEKDAENPMFLAHFDKTVSPKAVQTRWFCMLTWKPKGPKWKEEKTQKARMKGNERWEGKNERKWRPKRPKWRVRRQKWKEMKAQKAKIKGNEGREGQNERKWRVSTSPRAVLSSFSG